MFFISFLVHAVALVMVANWNLLGDFKPDETPVTYVDMVTLPVASPQSGTPAPAAEKAVEAAPQQAPPPVPPAMSQPVQPAKPTKPAAPAAKAPAAAAPGIVPKETPAAESEDFNQRMAKLERLAEEKRQAEVFERLKKKGTRTGMPGGKGNEAGSDYPSYLQSRLKDALKEVMVSQTKAPQVIATITVFPDGRVDYHVEKVSGDSLFDDAVRRAVTLAGKSLVPPPGGTPFKRMFRFRPEGVGIK